VTRPLHIAAFNAENFYLLLDRELSREELEALEDDEYLAMNASIYNPNKEREKISEIARIILRERFDVVGLCEVGGMETLSAFNKIYLDSGYECHLHERNSKRGIFVGAILKKGRFPRARARNVAGAFSRNLLRLDLGPEGGDLAILVVHLKSQHGDDRGLAQRVREVERLCEAAPRKACVVMGDFNGILIRGEHQFEYGPFLDLPFRDALEAVGVPPELRRTHYHFGKEPAFNQLDYIFCSNDIRVVAAGVIEGQIPLNRAQRDLLPSDHLFIRALILPQDEARAWKEREEEEARNEERAAAAVSATEEPPVSRVPSVIARMIGALWGRFARTLGKIKARKEKTRRPGR
jgi:endonuclease/exonuclease/phosphatase family metal-dependent hydrolase